MNTKTLAIITLLTLSAAHVSAQQVTPPTQGRPEAAGARMPPLQAFEDCKGKKAGDTVQHTTREGKVAATCAESPNGLVARPAHPPAPKPEGSDAPMGNARR